jgi:hypothetical protein
VIFTGRVSEHEMLEERGSEWDRLVKEGALKAVETDAPSPGLKALAYAIGLPAVTLGVITVILIVYSFVV